ncbi:DUF402 domain-containing protein [Amycolatopsis rubida]|uniref:DUF402 domain-containing protein n=1 Tax=Amycolatopsis rubida TaxID=112413 RepID=A0A1I5YMN7_9PSEU|nr:MULTISPECIES: DUF402 domain-containing protein [Amycolatopsis]MYW95037.1 DUF402 domain-containing protein [Amycolatopsis rubida]NEC60024.1 DUF402 domain-containing protein [Amycolatopsis rubida]OAP28200.1 hypothetical protein A4R44_01810 [Amycolatopsis sp. M39]SFQ45486.1 Protein of unknown function [Amycolatopsis rubida]
MTEHRWAPGQTVVERFVRPDGSIGQHHPLRVISDDGETLLGWLPLGTPIVGSRLADGRSLREAPLEQRFREPRVRVPEVWHGTSTLRLIPDRAWSSVWWFFEADGRFRDWYVNLEVPRGRTGTGPDRIDGILDLVVTPGAGWKWKDEDEAEAAVEAGRLTTAELGKLRAEGERLAGLAERGAYPFDGTHTDFRPDPDWPAPALPTGLC